LEETAALFPPVREAFKWVKRVARILKKTEQLPASKIRRRLAQLLVRMRRAAATTAEPSVQKCLRHFLKVTKSYRPGLFQCYASSDLPRTNNDLEHAFGSHRYHKRRASGRRRASPGLMVVGSARVISSLRPGYVSRWRELRADLEARRESRRRFRHDPASYLSQGVGAAVPPATFASLEKNIITNARPGRRRFPGIPASSRRERECLFGSRKSASKTRSRLGPSMPPPAAPKGSR
jgi:hypothetical protein